MRRGLRRWEWDCEDSVTDMQGHAASLLYRKRSHFPGIVGIMGMDERQNDGGMKRGFEEGV